MAASGRERHPYVVGESAQGSVGESTNAGPDDLRSYAVFLRGINVGGVRIAMSDLRECLTEAGLSDVRTYLQTGNVTCRFVGDPAKRRRGLEDALRERFGYDAHVQVVALGVLADVVEGCPFDDADTHHRYVVFVDDAEAFAALVEAARDCGPDERIGAGDGVLYWRCPRGSTLATPFGKTLGRHRLRSATTTRKLETILKMMN